MSLVETRTYHMSGLLDSLYAPRTTSTLGLRLNLSMFEVA